MRTLQRHLRPFAAAALMWAALSMVSPAQGRPLRLDQKQLDKISDHCSTPRMWLHSEHGEIHIQPDVSARYDRIDCVFTELKRDHATNMGFVGNEAQAPK